jgi:hypothetical protein
MTNLFEQATRAKLRYTLAKGTVTTEDLWDLRLEDLDTLAKRLNKEIKDSNEESFITTRSASNKKLELAFEIVKHVIAVRLAEKEKRAKSAENAARRIKLLELIAEKEDENTKGKSIEELRAELEGLQD